MKYFSLPADFKKETIDKYEHLNNKYPDSNIIETYGQITEGKFLGSGRMFDLLPKQNLSDLEDYISYSEKKGIKFNYTFNASCLGNSEFTKDGIYQLSNLLMKLHEVGVRSLTVTIPSLFELIKGLHLDFELKASAVCDITSPDKALFYQDLGADRIVLNNDVNRRIDNIKRITKVVKHVELIVNCVCYKNCPYKMFHYNHESHSSNTQQEIKNYYFQRCTLQKAANLRNVIRLNWIRPEDLNKYEQIGVHYFKLQGRNNVHTGDPAKAVECYLKGKFEGNLYDLLTLFSPLNAFHPKINNKELNGFVDIFFSNPMFCKEICKECNYCDSYAQKSMNVDEARELNKNITELYNGIDNYKNLIDSNYQLISEKKDIASNSSKEDLGDFSFNK